jgi:hypothetical protein
MVAKPLSDNPVAPWNWNSRSPEHQQGLIAVERLAAGRNVLIGVNTAKPQVLLGC